MNVTETPVLNQKLEVGAQTEQVTVESTVETIQTQNATVGTLVGSQTVTTLPLSSRNYTNIIDLSPGVVANVASAAAVGNGTQDINVNGNGSDQNNYMMDGATLTNYGSGGAAQSGNFPGIAIPEPGRDSGVQDSDFAVRRRIRPESGRQRQRHHQGRQQQFSRRCLGVLPE